MKVNVKLVFFKKGYGNQFNKLVRTLIQWWTKSPYYHVEIAIFDTWIKALNDGIVVTKDYPNESDYDCVELETELTLQQYTDLLAWVHSKNGSRYDYLGILLSTVVPARIDNPDKWFCSEITTKILQLMLDPKVYDLTPNMVTPADLAELYGVKNDK